MAAPKKSTLTEVEAKELYFWRRRGYKGEKLAAKMGWNTPGDTGSSRAAGAQVSLIYREVAKRNRFRVISALSEVL
jgi:hypothetical protein